MGAVVVAADYSAIGTPQSTRHIPDRAQNTGTRFIPGQPPDEAGAGRNPRPTMSFRDVHSAGWACACGIAFGIGRSTISG